jgi:predicted nuclease of predicted toxin-antitoxin system
VRILLDENFPLALHRALAEQGREVDHVILLGLRGCPDAALLGRLENEDILFLTQDRDFLSTPARLRGVVIVSRVRQERKIQDRVRIWVEALDRYFEARPLGRLFEIDDSGSLALPK